MAITRVIERTVQLDGLAWRESLQGLAYQGEQNAHQFIIHCTQDGAAVTLTGSVLLKFLRPDGIAVDVPGSVVDGAAVVTLSGNCYEVMGRAEITIFVTQDSATVAIYSANTAVTRTTSGEEISGGDIINLPALQERFEDMADAIEDCEAATAAAEGITDMIAPVESTSTASQAYAVGEYLIYNGTLYEVTAPIASGGTLTVGTNIAAVADGLGGDVADLKNAVTANQELTINGIVNLSLDNFFQRTGENRIWYREGRLIDGYIVGVMNEDYDVTPYYANYLANDWAKSFAIDNTSNYLGIAIRKSDKSDISGLTQQQLTDLINYGNETVFYKDIEALKATKFVHISFDDCVFWTDLIDNANVYLSAFDNPFLGYLKGLHDTYGAVFTLNCFCTQGNYSIENVPSNFATDFSNNKHWLRFAFHAEDSTSNYSTDAVNDIKASYNKFTSAIYTMTGDIDCIDRVTRLGYFSGTLNNVKGVRDVPCGVVGLLTSDDTRVSYYLGSADNTYILNHSHFLDVTNHIMFLHSQKRLEQTTLQNMESWLNGFKAVSGGNFANYLELFTHEYEWNTTMLNKMKACFGWLVANGYAFAFMEDVFHL